MWEKYDTIQNFDPVLIKKLNHNQFCLFQGVTYTASHYIQPELSQSQLSFRDLFLDPDSGRVSQSVCCSVDLVNNTDVFKVVTVHSI